MNQQWKNPSPPLSPSLSLSTCQINKYIFKSKITFPNSPQHKANFAGVYLRITSLWFWKLCYDFSI